MFEPKDKNRFKILTVLMIPLAMALLQVSSVNVALASLADALHASDSQLQWVLSGYALAIGVALIPCGRLGEIFGPSKIFFIGVALFTLFSGLCGTVSDPTTLNILRLFQGLAAGIYSPQVTAVIQQTFRNQERAMAFAIFGFVISVSVALGPMLAGALIQTLGADTGWRMSFLMNVPLGLIGLYTAWKWLPFAAEREALGKRGKSRFDLDPVGMLVLIAAVVCVMLPFMLHGTPWRWWLLSAAALAFGAWIYWERHYRGAPMVDLQLFRLPSFSYCVAVGTLQFLGITSVFALVAIFLQKGLGESAMIAGLIGLPNAVTSAIASLIAGRYAISHGRGLQTAVLGIMAAGVILAGIAGYFVVQDNWSPWWMAVGFAIQGIGQGAMSSINTTQAMLDVPPMQGGTAGGILQTTQRIATAIGNAVMTGIFFTLVAWRGWADAILYAYLIIGAITLAAMAAAWAYWRAGRKNAA